jgi:hypothetical protein
MTTFPTMVTIMDVSTVAAPVACQGPHQKGQDWPMRFTNKVAVGYFDVPLHGKKFLRVHFEIPLCETCCSLVVD